MLLRSKPLLGLRGARLISDGMPFRIRAPLAKLLSRKQAQEPASNVAAGGLGLGDPLGHALGRLSPSTALADGEALESDVATPDYVRLALTSRVYDFISESALQRAPGLSEKLRANVHLKREDTLPSFSFKVRGVYNLLAQVPVRAESGVITYSVGSQGHSIAVAARELGVKATIVMPERTPLKRRQAIEMLGAKVVVHGALRVCPRPACQHCRTRHAAITPRSPHTAGERLGDAAAEAERLAENGGGERMYFVEPHDHPLVIAGQATCALELVRQMGKELERRPGSGVTRAQLDAVFVVAGGSSLLAGVASVIKSISPHTKVIGVEAASADLLHRSLLMGHRLEVPEPAHFIDGASTWQLGPEVFRLCNELVDGMVTVSDDEICAAVRDCFEDTRAVLEPAGALATAGLKKYVADLPLPSSAGGSRGNFVAISSDASNIEFDTLRFIAERAAMGEQSEKLFALRVPDRTGMFFDMYQAVQPRLVTEFVYRCSPGQPDALVYMAMEAREQCGASKAELLPHRDFSGAVRRDRDFHSISARFTYDGGHFSQ